jgi:transposase InsO family protein
LEQYLDASLAMIALDQALKTRRPPRGSLIHHSDRGVQYASLIYRGRLAEHDVAISMSRPGNPFDNAKAESFMKTLKTEELNARSFKGINDARSRIDDFIANTYNTERLHSALGTARRLSSKPHSRKTSPSEHDYENHCNRNYRVSFKGGSPNDPPIQKTRIYPVL